MTPSSPWSRSTLFTRFAFVALTALAVVVFGGKAYENSLQALDSTTHAMLALNVTSDGLKPVLPMRNFVTNKKLNPVFNDHPFTLFYLSGHVMRAFGPEAWSARLVPTIFSAGCVLLLAWLGAMLYTPAVGLVAGLILMASRDFVVIGSRFHLDTAMIFFILLSFIGWWRRQLLLTGIAAGLGLWMKSPVAFLVFPSALLALTLSGKLDRTEFKRLFIAGLIAIGMGSMIWILTGLLGGWELVTDYWTRQVWGTAVGGRGGPGNYGFFWGLYLLKRNYLPWFPLLLLSLVAILLRRRWKDPAVALSLSAALILELVISSMRFKFFWYYLPVFPFLALLIVDGARNWLERRENSVSGFFVFMGLVLPTLLLATPIDFGPENFPALRRFHPIVQSYGTVEDQVYFIDGHQPYGSELDNIYELAFYTGRRILHSSCAEATAILAERKPEWIVVSGPHFTECISPAEHKLYPIRYKFGRQYLLSKIVPVQSHSDLTPLFRELKPLRDGQPVPTPSGEYFPVEPRSQE